MKRFTRSTLIALSLSALSVSAFAANAREYYPGNSPASGTSAVQQGKTRAQVKAELVAAEKDGSLQTLNQTVYAGH